jgi:lipoate-protein ligase A
MQDRAGRFGVEHHRGSPGELHSLSWPAPPTVLLLEPTSSAVVLGSVGSAVPCVTTPVPLVRRRSGGGAVLVEPGRLVWIDVVIGRDDPQWDDDIVRSFHWLGQLWRAALVDLGCPEVTLFPGPQVRSALGDLACFAGLGAGELTIGGRKVVGLSQRRTRAGARYQGACLLDWHPAPLADTLALDDADAAVLDGAAMGLREVLPGVQPAAVNAAVLAALARLA